MLDRTARVDAANKVERERISAVRKRRVVQVSVHSPYGHGIDRVQKVFDQLATMFKRKQLTERQFQAGERLQRANDVIYGQAGGAMDFDRARGSGVPGQPPIMPYLLASESIANAKNRLYPRDFATVWRVCIEGKKVDDCCGLFNEGPGGREAGRALRRGLDELADMWWPIRAASGKASFFRTEVAVAGEEGVVTVGEVYLSR